MQIYKKTNKQNKQQQQKTIGITKSVVIIIKIIISFFSNRKNRTQVIRLLLNSLTFRSNAGHLYL